MATPPVVTSSYLQYLPTPYQDDAFMGRFLLIFESILSPIEQTIDGVASYFDPRLAPEDWLPWLASWMGVELDENWPIERRRQLVARAAELLRIQGTRRALREHIELYAGRLPLIVENFSGLRLGQDGLMGVNAQLGERQPHSIDVTVIADRPLDERVLRGIIETHKPAQVGYTLQIRSTADLRPGDPPSSLSDGIRSPAKPDQPIEPPIAVTSGESA
jgi:phage tail-like protein